ncbi:riboflavin-binding protein RibY [Pseudoclavibacter endophyticus]|nr:riboflavin-binding protein RibY [Pseudoclavibacter endophyticus]
MLTVGLTYTPNIQFSPFYVAAEQGFFEEVGLDVELRHHGQSEDLFGALQSGTEDVVYAGGDEIVQARSNGTDVVSIATLYSEYPAALIVPRDSPIETAADVRGRTIGTPGPFGQTYFALLALLQSGGMSEADIDLQSIGYTQQVALTSGKVEGVMGFVNNDAVQFERAGFPVRVIDVFAEEQELVGPAVGASQATIDARGDDLALLMQALEKATQFVIDNPEETVELSAAHIPTLTTDEAKADALATLDATVPLLEPAGGAPRFENRPEVWDAMVAFMGGNGLLGETAVVAGEAYTNAFVPGA